MEFSGERFVPSLHGPIYYEHVHRYAIAARFSVGKRVLDIASGEGYGSNILARTAAEVTGVDIDDTSVEHARSVYYASNLRFLRGSAMEIPLPDASVDVAASFETIEHVGEPERMLDELRRVLVPDGLLIISSPNKRVYSDLPGYSNPFHVRELYFSELRDVLQRRFRNVALYGQRMVSASVVHPLAGAVSRSPSWYNGPDNSGDQGLPTVADPLYFFAICTDGAFDIDACSAFLDPDDDMYADLAKELDALRRHYALTVHAPGSQNGNGATVLSAPVQAALAGADPAAPASTADDERFAAQARETERVLAAYQDALAALREREAALAAAEERERTALAESEQARLQMAEATSRLERAETETSRLSAVSEDAIARLGERQAALSEAYDRERAAQLEVTRLGLACEELTRRLEAGAAELAASAIREEERSLENLRLAEEVREAALENRALASERDAARRAGVLDELAAQEWDVAEPHIASLQAALENSPESAGIVRRAFERGRELTENQRAVLSYCERSLKAAEATRLDLLRRVDDLLEERSHARGLAQQLHDTQRVLAQRTSTLASVLASAEHVRGLLKDGLAERERSFEGLLAALTATTRGRFGRSGGRPDVLADRTVALARVLARQDGMRTLLDEGLADRERGFEAIGTALAAVAANERRRGDRAVDSLAEVRARYGEAVAAASGTRQFLEQGLADRDRSFEAVLAIVSQRDRAVTEARVDEQRRGETLLEQRTLQLAGSLDCVARERAIVVEVLRIYREAFELLRARHESDLRALVRPPGVARSCAATAQA